MPPKACDRTAPLTFQRLKEVLSYDPSTGEFSWNGTWTGRKNGSCGWIDPTSQYHCIAIDRRTYKAHRLAWLYMTGEWPSSDLDHANGHRLDNRFCNLRIASPKENAQNRKTRRDNVSGYKGVCFRKDRKTLQYQALICIDTGRKKHLGFFETPEEAHAAYAAAALENHGKFARLA